MKILYLSCHSILEYDEVSLFHELGHEVFSAGAYVCPENPGDASLRPGIVGLAQDPEDLAMYKVLEQNQREDAKRHLTKEFVDRFDVIIVMHIPEWVAMNWGQIGHKCVVWRTIGQSVSEQEKWMAKYRAGGMKIVRYSPLESRIPNFCGRDTTIRFYKDPDEYGGWTGEHDKVLTVNQAMKARRVACNYDIYEQVTNRFGRVLYGPGNEDINEPYVKGKVPYEEIKEAMRTHRCYFYVGTQPASYTLNFIEAWMTGIPIVAIGPSLGNSKVYRGHFLYEIHKLLDSTINGLWSNDPEELRGYIRLLMEHHELAKQIGDAGRQKAIETFGKQNIKEQWNQFFQSIG